MGQLKINKDKITHIELYDFEDLGYEWVNYVYKPNWLERLLGSKKENHSGYYRNGVYSYARFKYGLHYEEVKQGEIDKRGKLYEKPKAIIFIEKYVLRVRYFESYKEALDFCKKEFPNVNYIL